MGETTNRATASNKNGCTDRFQIGLASRRQKQQGSVNASKQNGRDAKLLDLTTAFTSEKERGSERNRSKTIA